MICLNEFFFLLVVHLFLSNILLLFAVNKERNFLDYLNRGVNGSLNSTNSLKYTIIDIRNHFNFFLFRQKTNATKKKSRRLIEEKIRERDFCFFFLLLIFCKHCFTTSFIHWLLANFALSLPIFQQQQK